MNPSRDRFLPLVALLSGLVLLGSASVQAQLVAEPESLEVQLQRESLAERTVTLTNTGSEAVAYCLSFDRPLQRQASGHTRLAPAALARSGGAPCGEVGELLILVDQESAQIGWDLNGTAMTPDGHLFASDFADSRTHELTQDLEVIRSFNHPEVADLVPFPATTGLAFDALRVRVAPGRCGGSTARRSARSSSGCS